MPRLPARGTGPLEINGQSRFNSLQEAQLAAQLRQGSEAIVQRDDGSFELSELNTTSQLQTAVAQQAQNKVKLEVSFADLDLPGNSRAVAVSLDSPATSGQLVHVAAPLKDAEMEQAYGRYQQISKEEMEKEFRFAPEGSDKWKLFKAMELVAKLEHDMGSVKDLEARQVLQMRKAEIVDLVNQLNQKPEIKAAFERVKAHALRSAGISSADLVRQGNYLLSASFRQSLQNKPPEEQSQLLQREIAKIQFFDPEYGAVVAAELGAQTLIDEGLSQLHNMDEASRNAVKVNIQYLIDDLMKDTTSRASNAFKPVRELHKIMTQLHPEQMGRFRDVLVELSIDIESMDAKGIVNAIKTVEGLPPDLQDELAKLDWHGELRKVLSSVAAVGSLISLGRSAEELQAKGWTFKNSVDLVKNTASLIGSSKDIAQTAGTVTKWAKMDGISGQLTGLGKSLDAMKVVKWAGPISSAISGGWDLYEMSREISNEDTAGAWLKGISGTAGLVAAGAGGVAAWYGAGATATAIAGPIGLAAVAVGAAAAITYSFVAESEETGEFRKELRALGISDQEESIEQAFQQASWKNDPKQGRIRSAETAFEWVKDKPLEEKARLINALLDQYTEGYEEQFLALLLKDSIGKNRDAQGVDDLERLLARTDVRRLSAELENNQIKPVFDSLRQRQRPAAQQALEQLCVGLSDGHRLDWLKQSNGKPQPFVQQFSPQTLQQMASAVMKGITWGQEETFISRLIVDQPVERLSEVLARGGSEFMERLVAEIPKADTGKLLSRFVEMDHSLRAVESQLQQAKAAGQPTQALEQRQNSLKHALDDSLNSFAKILGDNTNTWLGFAGVQDTLKNTLQPEITRHLTPDTLEHLTRKLMSAPLFTPADSSKAMVKLLQQATPAQFEALISNNTDTYVRKVLASSLDNDQAQELLNRFLAGGTQPTRAFQTFALGLIEKGQEAAVKTFLAARPHLDLSKAPALQVLTSEKTSATLQNLVRDRQKIAGMSVEEKAIIVKYLMDGWSSDPTETLIHDILVDTHRQSPEQFKQLVSSIDAYKLANELGDAFIAGRGTQESLKVFELMARSASPEDFEAYATRLGADDNVAVLYRFTSKPENQPYIGKLPGKALQEMAEGMMKGYTGDQAEVAITKLLVHSSDAAFVDMLSQQDFANWLSKELHTDGSKWFTTLTGEADQLLTIMNRLGKMATDVGRVDAKHQGGSKLSDAEKSLLALKPKIIASANAYGLAIAQQDYGRILLKTANSPDTEATIRLISPPVLKAMLEQIMAGYTGEESEDAISAMLQKTSVTQLRDLLDKNVGGQKLVDQLGNELDGDHLRSLMEKLISDRSIKSGMGFSYLAAKLADKHEGTILRDLIGQRPEVVRQIHPTVLQDIAIKLSKGWTSADSQQAITGILSNASPEQLELLMQSNVSGKPQHVADYIVTNINDAQLKQVLANFARGKGSGTGLNAFLTSLAHKRPDVLNSAAAASLHKLSADSLQVAMRETLKAWEGSFVLGAPYQAALNHLIDTAKDSQTLGGLLKDLDGKTLGRALDDNPSRNQKVIQQLMSSGTEAQLKAYLKETSVSTLQSSWSAFKTQGVNPPAAAREALFQHFVDAGDENRALEMLQGVSSVRGMGSLAGTANGQRMLDYLATRMGNFNKNTAPKMATWILAHGSQSQIDTAMRKIRNDFYFGNGGAVIKAVIDQANAQGVDIKGKLSISTLRSMVNTLDSTWTKMFGDYASNVRYVGQLADLVDTHGKAVIIQDLMSGWTPGEAETLIHDIFKKTSSPQAFTQLVDQVGASRISKELEERSELGKVMAYVVERYDKRYSSGGRDDDAVLNEIMNQWSGLSIKSDDVIWQMLKQLERDGKLGQLKSSVNNSTLDKMIDWSNDAFRDGNVWDLDAESEWSIQQLRAAKT